MTSVSYIMKSELKQPYKQFFGTLANQHRLDIIETLIEGPKNVSQIVSATKHKQPTVSHSLRRLEKCGFVSVKPNGKERVYRLNQKTIKPLLGLMHTHMNNYCCKIVE